MMPMGSLMTIKYTYVIEGVLFGLFEENVLYTSIHIKKTTTIYMYIFFKFHMFKLFA